jgi:hypothetical protein
MKSHVIQVVALVMNLSVVKEMNECENGGRQQGKARHRRRVVFEFEIGSEVKMERCV